MNLKDNGAYAHCATVSIEIDDKKLGSGDAIRVYATQSISIRYHEDAELIFVEEPMKRGISLK
ncbi:MAG: hypothetical protein LW721_08135 [Flammeovirgaceae bacterium]|jgi:hypothetical protein|nr:hypothetical protein [Flammeovirgaceae bacterium]